MFKNTIKSYLENQAKNDPLFAQVFEKENKNIDECITYILNRVKESGCNGFADDEIFGMALHYYQEDDIKVGNPINAKVVVNHSEENKGSEKIQAPVIKMIPTPTPVQKPARRKKESNISTDQLTLF